MVPGQELRLLGTETYFWVIPGIFLTPILVLGTLQAMSTSLR